MDSVHSSQHKMSLCKVTCFLIWFVLLQVKGNPLPHEIGSSNVEYKNNGIVRNLLRARAHELVKSHSSSLRSLRRSQNYYLCGDRNSFFPLASFDYSLDLRQLRQRCRYFEEPWQKYTTWDLARR